MLLDYAHGRSLLATPLIHLAMECSTCAGIGETLDGQPWVFLTPSPVVKHEDWRDLRVRAKCREPRSVRCKMIARGYGLRQGVRSTKSHESGVSNGSGNSEFPFIYSSQMWRGH